MTLQDLFDTLLLERRAAVLDLSKQQANSLRIQLVKKWSKYKAELDALGFLADDLVTCSMCMKETERGYEFLLQPRQRTPANYQILTEQPAEQGTNETV